jgi:hypothetical protein
VTSDKRESKKWLEAVLDALHLLYGVGPPDRRKLDFELGLFVDVLPRTQLVSEGFDVAVLGGAACFDRSCVRPCSVVTMAWSLNLA